jgi:head-tail adaptor
MKQVFEKMRARLRVQKKVTSDDGFGGRVEKWEDIEQVWGSLVFVSAKEITGGSLSSLLKHETQGQLIYRLTLRPRATLLLPARFHSPNGQRFQSLGPLIPDETGGYMSLYVCEL